MWKSRFTTKGSTQKSCNGGLAGGKKSFLGASGSPEDPARQVSSGSPPPLSYPRQQELLFHFLQLVAGVEHHQQKFRSQASVLDEIVDTAFEVGRAGPEERGQSGRAPEGQAWEPHAQRAPNSDVGVWEGRGWHWLSRPPIPPPQAGEEDFRK